MQWKPNVTVAAIVENDGRFLLVEEDADNAIVINQPAGHLEKNESDRKSTRLNSSHMSESRMPSSA